MKSSLVVSHVKMKLGSRLLKNNSAPIIRVWRNEWHSSCVYYIIGLGQDAGPWEQTMHINTTNSHLRWWKPERVSRILEMKKFIVKKLVIQKHFMIRIFLITIIVLGDSCQHYEQQLKILLNIQWNLNPSFLKISWRKTVHEWKWQLQEKQ
jgi:hypothetical protein